MCVVRGGHPQLDLLLSTPSLVFSKPSVVEVRRFCLKTHFLGTFLDIEVTVSCSQCNLAANLCCGERASTLNEELIIREFRGGREKGAALYNITCLGEILVPFPTFNLFNQSLKKGVFQYDKPSAITCHYY